MVPIESCVRFDVVGGKKTDRGESIATDFNRGLFRSLLCVYLRSQSVDGIGWWQLDLERFLKIYLYGSFSAMYRSEQEKPSPSSPCDERTTRNLATLEFRWVRVILCTIMLCFGILTWLVNRRDLASHDHIRCFTRPAIF